MLNMFWIQNINIFIDPRGGEMKIQLNYRLCKLCSQSNLRFVIANWCCLWTVDCRLNIKIQLYLQQSSPRHPATSPSTPPHLLTLTGVTRLKLIVLWLNGGMFRGIFSNYPETKLMFIFAFKKYWRRRSLRQIENSNWVEYPWCSQLSSVRSAKLSLSPQDPLTIKFSQSTFYYSH